MIFKRFKHLWPNLLLTLPLLILTVALSINAGINGYLIALCVSVYLMVSGLTFYRINTSHHQQMGILSDLLEALIAGDYTFRGKDLYSAHFQSLLERVNQLAATLQSQTVALRESQLLVQQVIDHMDAALIATNDQGQMIFSNRAAQGLLGVKLNAELQIQLMKTTNGKSVQLKEQWLAGTRSGGEFLVQRDSFITQGKQNQLIMLSEVGQLLHYNESAAWQRLVRVISHEINNSMTPVSTISRTMLRNADKHNLPGNFVEGLGVIQNRCEHMIQFIASYTKIAQLPSPNRQPVVIKSLIDNCTALFAQRTFEVIGDMSEKVYCDPGQIQQVLINLLKNADDAMSESPAAIVIEAKVIEAKKVQKQLVLTITDQGCGIANPDNLFVPFYTTKSSGSGIGLMLSQQIVNNHFGRLTLENRQGEEGAVARIVLPFE
ncbi:MAG: hypothetical protein HRT35_08580 [Algicola sp.]|nr:hypothetical protein [Algicola sp.]